MIDLTLLRKNPQHIITLLATKDPSFDAQRLFALDEQVVELKKTIESLQCTKNNLVKDSQAGVTEALREQSIALAQQIKEKQLLLDSVEKEFRSLYLSCPNLPSQELPIGGKEANKVVKIVGEKPVFDFSVKNHVDLNDTLGWINFERAAQMTGSNFVLYRGEGVKLLYALTMLMIKNNQKFGYELILPPALLNAQSLEVASNFPRFKDQVYAVEKDGLYLTPTAEVDLANLYRDSILTPEQLPVRMTSWTSCFRREAGSYGSTERGLIRIHQFEKVELFSLCEPAESPAEQERMLACAESILQMLGLHYRVSLLATQDCSFASFKTYDIEVWLPGQGTYFEVSSISNCTDFQSRRGMIRYKKDGKNSLVHTLNGSSLALPRLMVAIMETYQQPDGSVVIPEILKQPISVF